MGKVGYRFTLEVFVQSPLIENEEDIAPLVERLDRELGEIEMDFEISELRLASDVKKVAGWNDPDEYREGDAFR